MQKMVMVIIWKTEKKINFVFFHIIHFFFVFCITDCDVNSCKSGLSYLGSDRSRFKESKQNGSNLLLRKKKKKTTINDEIQTLDQISLLKSIQFCVAIDPLLALCTQSL